MSVYCEGSRCAKRNTCKLHCDIQADKVYEYIDYSMQGSGHADSSGNITVDHWCGDDGDYKRYQQFIKINLSARYDIMWYRLKDILKELNHNSFSYYPSAILSQMQKLEDEFKIKFPSKVKIEDIREEKYETWCHYKYEDHNTCPMCNAKLIMTGQVSEYQHFKCPVCEYNFELNIYKNELTLQT